MKVKVKLEELRKWFNRYTDINTDIEQVVELEAEPVVERPEWEIKFDEKIVVDTYGAKDFIRKEIISKLVDDIIKSCCPDMGAEELVCEVRDRWLGGSR